MSLAITMPQLGLTMTEGSVSTWLKEPGDTVIKDEVILTVSTDKVDMDVESPVDGTLKEIVIGIGQMVPVGTPLAYIEELGGDSGGGVELPAKAASSKTKTVSVPDTIVTKKDEETLNSSQREQDAAVASAAVSPRARRLARELGIDLSHVKGSGPGGRIVEDDLQTLVPKNAPRQAEDTDTKRRQLIAERMVESINTIPAFSVSVEANAENLVALYESLKGPVGKAAGTKLTYTDLLLKALAVSLTKTPEMNRLWNGGAIRQLSDVSLGLAVATERGVAAPTLTGVERYSLEQIVRRRAELTDKARQSRLAFADIEGAVGTLSNLGMYRVDRFEGIITPGQSFILAVGSLQRRPWVDTTLVVKPTVILNLSIDHRVADGAIAAVFLQRIAEVIENPYQILWNSDTGEAGAN